MDFAATAEAIEEAVVQERMRLEFTHWNAIRGHCTPVADQVLAAWRARLVRLEAGAAVFRILAEPALAAAVRALDPRFERLLG